MLESARLIRATNRRRRRVRGDARELATARDRSWHGGNARNDQRMKSNAKRVQNVANSDKNEKIELLVAGNDKAGRETTRNHGTRRRGS